MRTVGLLTLLLGLTVAAVAANPTDAPTSKPAGDGGNPLLLRAMGEAGSIPDDVSRFRALTDLELAWALAGDVEHSEQAFDAIQGLKGLLQGDDPSRDMEVGQAIFKLGQAAAVLMVDSSRRGDTAAVERIAAKPSTGEMALKWLTISQAREGRFDAALATAARMKPGMARNVSYATIARLQAGAGRIDESLATLQRIGPDTLVGPMMYDDTLRAMVRSGDTQRALKLARSLPDDPPGKQQTHSLVAIVDAQAEKGDAVAAVQTSDQIKDVERREWALASAAIAQAKRGDFGAAQATIGMITGPWGDMARGTLAYFLAKAGQTDQANATAEGAKDPAWRTRAFMFLGRAHRERKQAGLARVSLAEAGKSAAQISRGDQTEGGTQVALVKEWIAIEEPNAARRVMEDITGIDASAAAAAEIAGYLTGTGKLDEARDLSKHLPALRASTAAQAAIVRVQAEAGHFDEATATALAMPMTVGQDRALRALGAALAKAGKHEKLELTLGALPNCEQRVYLLLGAGEAQTKPVGPIPTIVELTMIPVVAAGDSNLHDPTVY